jgi:hypothetical protein
VLAAEQKEREARCRRAAQLHAALERGREREREIEKKREGARKHTDATKRRRLQASCG